MTDQQEYQLPRLNGAKQRQNQMPCCFRPLDHHAARTMAIAAAQRSTPAKIRSRTPAGGGERRPAGYRPRAPTPPRQRRRKKRAANNWRGRRYAAGAVARDQPIIPQKISQRRESDPPATPWASWRYKEQGEANPCNRLT